MNTPINIEIAEILFKKHSVLLSNISDVIMWLYEKHGIWIAVELYYNPSKIDKIYFEYGVSNIKSREEGLLKNASKRISSDWINNPKEYNLYDSPTEAYEAAIEYTLNNLI